MPVTRRAVLLLQYYSVQRDCFTVLRIDTSYRIVQEPDGRVEGKHADTSLILAMSVPYGCTPQSLNDLQ